MPPLRRIFIMAISTGIMAALAASLSVDWMRYLVVVLIGVVGALFWQVNEVREEAERRVVRAMSHHLNNGLNIVMNRRHLDPNAREQIVDDQVLRWACMFRRASMAQGVRPRGQEDLVGVSTLWPPQDPSR